MPETTGQLIQIGTATLGIPVAVAYGPVRARGNQVLLHELADKTRIVFLVLGEGEWDGIDRLFINSKIVDHTDTGLVHFHPGTEPAVSNDLTPGSTGGDNLVDAFYSSLPDGLPRLTFSGMAYIALKVPPDPGAPSPDLDIFGDYRTKKVRTFDASGAQTGYLYTVTPAWQILDCLLRLLIKRDALRNETLTAAEKERIDFQSFVDAASYQDELLASGDSRFRTAMPWPNAITAAQALDQILTASRSYLREVDGKWQLNVDKPRASSFTLLARHVVPKSFFFEERDLGGAANQFTGQFNDIKTPVNASIDTPANSGVVRSSNVVTLKTIKQHGYRTGDTVVIQKVDDASFDGEFVLTSAPDANTLKYAQAGANATSGNGIVGSPEQIFTQRSSVVDHDQHALAIGLAGPGLGANPLKVPINIDFGNCSLGQVRRVLKFLSHRTLGPDSTPYKAPFDAQAQVFIDAIDDAGAALMELAPGDLVMVDNSVDEEGEGLYELLELHAPQVGGEDSSDQVVEILMKQYYDAAFTDDPGDEQDLTPGNQGRPLPAQGGPANGAYVVNNQPLTATDAGTTATINVAAPDVRFVGVGANPTYDAGAVTNLSFSTKYVVFFDDPDLRGGAVTYMASTLTPDAVAAVGRIILGTITTPADGGGDTTYDPGSGGSGPHGVNLA